MCAMWKMGCVRFFYWRIFVMQSISPNCFAVMAGALIAMPVYAADTGYPNKPIRWVVPFAPGGGTDIIARPIALKLGDRLGQSILYDNRGGGGGVIAGEIVAKANPDGYTLLVAAVAVMTVTVSLQKIPFDPVADFAPITKFASVPEHPGRARALSGAHNPGDRPARQGESRQGDLGDVRHGLGRGPGDGAVPAEDRHQRHTLPHKGAGPAMLALLSNDADLLFANPGVFMPHIKAGRLRALAAASLQRIPLLPDLPTLHESGYSGFESGSWYGLAAPARTPQAVIAFLHREVVGVLKQPESRRSACAGGRHRGRQHSAGVRPGNTRRHREMGEGDQGRKHQALRRKT